MEATTATRVAMVLTLLMMAAVTVTAGAVTERARDQKQQQQDQDVETGLDLSRYTGLWYEIARTRMPTDDTFNTTAQYMLNPNNTITALNTAFSPSRGRESIVALVFKQDANSPEAKFRLRFQIGGGRALLNYYWVLRVDKAKYQWSLIGEPTRTTFGILSRSKTLPDNIYHRLVRFAGSQGYDLTNVRFTRQT